MRFLKGFERPVTAHTEVTKQHKRRARTNQTSTNRCFCRSLLPSTPIFLSLSLFTTAAMRATAVDESF
jgi:hypothetical protein